MTNDQRYKDVVLGFIAGTIFTLGFWLIVWLYN